MAGERKMKSAKRYVLKGTVVSEGIACGRPFIYRDILSRELQDYAIEPEEIMAELTRVKKAREIALKELETAEKTVESFFDPSHSEIFQAQAEMLKDPELEKDLTEEVRREMVNAEQALRNVYRRWVGKLRVSKDKTVRARAEDIEDLGRRLLRILLGYETSVLERLPHGTIIVTRCLLPSDTIALDANHAKGIVVEQGSPNSHSAVLARTMGIPAVADIKISSINRHGLIILDANKGELICHPSRQDVGRYEQLRRSGEREYHRLARQARLPARTKSGRRVRVYANIARSDDTQQAIKNGCEGIGLFRIEQIYLAHHVMPSEDDLIQSIAAVLRGIGRKPVVLRLLDIGGDKQIPSLKREPSISPFLGLRGIRLLLRRPELLHVQLAAIMRLRREFDLRVLVPMITLPEEMREVREATEKYRREILGRKSAPLPLGAMIETPAAVLILPELAKNSDFFSIGTNDLIQYTMAAGREDKEAGEYYNRGTKLILKQIKKISRAAAARKIECSICGEMAGNLELTRQLAGSSITALSVAPRIIPKLKEKIRSLP